MWWAAVGTVVAMLALPLQAQAADCADPDPLAALPVATRSEIDQTAQAKGPGSRSHHKAVRDYTSSRSMRALLRASCDPQAALEALQEAYELNRSVLGPNDPDTIEAQRWYGMVLAQVGRSEEAAKMVTAANKAKPKAAAPVEDLTDKGLPGPRTTTDAEGRRIDALQGKGDQQWADQKWAAAHRTFNDLLAYKLSLYGEDDYRTARTVMDVAMTLVELDRYAEAAAAMRRVLAIYAKSNPYGDIAVSETNDRLEKVLMLMERQR